MKKQNKKGFTLAELLIVVAIIAVLVAVSIPVFTKQLEKSREETDMANIRSAYAIATTDALTGSYKGEDGSAQKDPYVKSGNVYYAYYDTKQGKLASSDTKTRGKGTTANGNCEAYTSGPMFYNTGTNAQNEALIVVIKDTGGVPENIYAGFQKTSGGTPTGVSSDFDATAAAS